MGARTERGGTTSTGRVENAEPKCAPEDGKTQVCIVWTEVQPELGAGTEHAVGL